MFEIFQLKYKYQIIFISTEIRLEKKTIKLYHQCFLKAVKEVLSSAAAKTCD